MKPFDLEKALAGEKVVTRDGTEVTQITEFDCKSPWKVHALVMGNVEVYKEDGSYHEDKEESVNDLFMAPTKLSGFINVYTDDTITIHETKQSAEIDANCRVRKAFIDLSQFEEGYGLD